jgi:hypothetical protein
VSGADYDYVELFGELHHSNIFLVQHGYCKHVKPTGGDTGRSTERFSVLASNG